jgi:hypothetical protein
MTIQILSLVAFIFMFYYCSKPNLQESDEDLLLNWMQNFKENRRKKRLDRTYKSLQAKEDLESY